MLWSYSTIELAMKEKEAVYNWNKHPVGKASDNGRSQVPDRVDIDDETLRDGLQGTQVEHHPSTREKKIYLEKASKFVEHADIGFSGSSDEHQQEIKEIIEYTLERRLPITLSVAARGAAKADIEPAIDISHELDGYPLEIDAFFDGSSYRARKEGWDRKEKLAQLAENIKLLKQHNLPVMFVAERATSTSPNELFELVRMVLDLGVERVGLADTQGRANPQAVSNMLRASFDEFKKRYPEVRWDFHGHNDLGLAVANCLIASEEGVDRVHVTSFGIGERVGNADLATTLLVLNLHGYRNDDLSELQEFSKRASEILHFTVPRNAPVVGESAFATSSGVHSAPLDKSNNDVSDIYFPYDPRIVGEKPKVEIGLFSGAATVRYKLKSLGIQSTKEMVEDILEEAKSGRGFISETTIRGIAQRHLNHIRKD